MKNTIFVGIPETNNSQTRWKSQVKIRALTGVERSGLLLIAEYVVAVSLSEVERRVRVAAEDVQAVRGATIALRRRPIVAIAG